MIIWGIGMTGTEDPDSRIAGPLPRHNNMPALDEILNLRN
jgi:hypothetical protein